MRYLRRIYNVNRNGNYPAVSFPQELADLLTQYVYMEEVLRRNSDNTYDYNPKMMNGC
jgi:hypothetical protein